MFSVTPLFWYTSPFSFDFSFFCSEVPKSNWGLAAAEGKNSTARSLILKRKEHARTREIGQQLSVHMLDSMTLEVVPVMIPTGDAVPKPPPHPRHTPHEPPAAPGDENTTHTAPIAPRHRRPTSSSTARSNNSTVDVSAYASLHTPRGFAAVCVLPCGLRGSPPRDVFRTNAASLLKLSKDRPSSSTHTRRPPSVGVVQSWFHNAHPAEMMNNRRVLDSFPTLTLNGTQHQQLLLTKTPTVVVVTHPPSSDRCGVGGENHVVTTTTTTAAAPVGEDVKAMTSVGGTGPYGQIHVYTSGLPHTLRSKHRSASAARPPCAASVRSVSRRPCPPSPLLEPNTPTSRRAGSIADEMGHRAKDAASVPLDHRRPQRRANAEDRLPPTPKLKSRHTRNRTTEQQSIAARSAEHAAAAAAAGTSEVGRSAGLSTDETSVGTDDLIATQGNLIRLMYRALQETVSASSQAPPYDRSCDERVTQQYVDVDGGGVANNNANSSTTAEESHSRRAELLGELKESMEGYQQLQHQHQTQKQRAQVSQQS
jgi:hypothetical protein